MMARFSFIFPHEIPEKYRCSVSTTEFFYFQLINLLLSIQRLRLLDFLKFDEKVIIFAHYSWERFPKNFSFISSVYSVKSVLFSIRKLNHFRQFHNSFNFVVFLAIYLCLFESNNILKVLMLLYFHMYFAV